MTPNRKRILFLIPSLAGGGAERVFITLLRHLDRTRFEPQLALLEAKGAYVKDIPSDVAVHDLKVRRVRYALPSLIRLIWRTKPDAVLSTLGHLNVALALVKTLLPGGARLLIRETTTPSVLLKETKHTALWMLLYRHVYHRADKIICLSEFMATEMIECFGVPREKLVRIYNPVDRERIETLAEQGENPFIGFGPGPYFVAAGRLGREKGFDILLDAMPPVLKAFPTARLTILGEGPLRMTLEEQAQRLGLGDAVNFPGFEPNPWRYLKHAHAFVLPSRYEGFSNAMLEALALRTPVIATDCPSGVREVLDEAEDMILVPPEDPVALARCIISMSSTLGAREERVALPREYLSRFNLHRIVKEYSGIF